MKKTLIKVGFVVFCIAAIIFLLLPFLETTPPPSTTLKEGQAQVVTENPLNVISKRLASLFGRKEKAKKTLSGQNTPADNPLTARHYGPYIPSNSPTSAHSPTAPGAPSSQTIDVSSQNYPFDYEDASFQADNGEWVLVQQTAPQHSAPGMHEVNVHDNPYDRYMRQERAKNFGPQAPKQEIPDSKWARLTRPFQTFFGLKDPQSESSANTRGQRGHEKGNLLGSGSNTLGTNKTNNYSGYAKPPRSLPDLSLQDWVIMSSKEREAYQKHKSARDFADLLSGEHAAREAAEIIADIQFPNPKNDQEKQAKESLIERLTAINKEKIGTEVLANMEEKAAEWDADMDEVALTTGCNASLPSANSCSLRIPKDNEEKEIQQAQIDNANAFFEQTQFVLPKGLEFTPVLAPTNPDNFKQMENQVMGTIYTSMYEQKKCDTQRCWWVPNTNQADPTLANAYTAAGGSQLVGDPLNTYDAFKEPWMEQELKKREEAQKAAPEKQQEMNPEAILKQLNQQWEANRASLVPYTDEDLQKLSNNNKNSLMAAGQVLATGGNIADANITTPVFPVVINPALAPEMASVLGPLSFVYHNPDPLWQSNNAIEGGRNFTNSLANDLNTVKDATIKITENATQESVQNAISTINNVSSQSNSAGGGIFNLLKNFVQGSHPKK